VKKTLFDYWDDRAQIVEKMNAILDRAAEQNRDLTDAEIQDYEALEAKQAKIGKHVDLIQRNENLNSGQDDAPGRGTRIGLSDGQGGIKPRMTPERRRIIPANESFAKATGAPPPPAGVSLGGILRGMVGAGPVAPEIRNALSVGTDSAGGYTVPTSLMGQIIDTLRAKSVCNAAGCQTVVLDSQTTNVARLASDPTASWRAEAGAVAESDPTFENVSFNAKSLAVLVKVSIELLQDSVNVEDALMNAFAMALANTLDLAALYGTGTSNQPTGVVHTPGVGSVSMGDNGAALSSYNPLIDAWYELAVDNANGPTAAVMAPRTLAALSKLSDGQGQPLMRPSLVANLPLLSTTNMPIDETQGTSDNASSIILGDFSQLWVGIRQQLRIEVLNQLYAENLQVGFIAHLRADVALAHPQSFCRISGVIPA
jgi:HK97 family phage major capsid protein